MADVVKEASDVRIQYPVHFLLLDAHIECVQSSVTASSRTKAITKTLKILFVDGKRPVNHILPVRLFWVGFITLSEWRSVQWRMS